jgi:hypothetical protein
MRLSLLLLAGVGAVSVMLTSVPARADGDDWRRHEWREQGREHEWRERQRYVYAPPPVYYYPPPGYYPPPEYYAPPPAYGPGTSLFGPGAGNSLFGAQ